MNPLVMHAFFHELSKISSIDPEEVRKSIHHLNQIEENSPDAQQLKRYSLLGAVTGPIIGAAQDLMETKSLRQMTPAGTVDRYRTVMKPVSRALAGAVATGVLPVLRHRMDRAAARDDLRKKLEQYENETRQMAMNPGIKSASSLIPSGSTPRSRNASSDQVGEPRMTNLSGPSIGQVSRTFGKIQPGAAKGTI